MQLMICNNCGTIFDADDYDIKGICPDCESDNIDKAVECEICGDTVPESIVVDVDGMKVCDDCAESERSK